MTWRESRERPQRTSLCWGFAASGLTLLSLLLSPTAAGKEAVLLLHSAPSEIPGGSGICWSREKGEVADSHPGLAQCGAEAFPWLGNLDPAHLFIPAALQCVYANSSLLQLLKEPHKCCHLIEESLDRAGNKIFTGSVFTPSEKNPQCSHIWVAQDWLNNWYFGIDGYTSWRDFLCALIKNKEDMNNL